MPPTWLSPPQDLSVIAGQPVTFSASAIGYPDPIIRWKRQSDNSSDFKVIISNANMQTLENGSLVIREASKSDAGRYMCQALNGVGPGVSVVVKLTVHG